MAKSEITLASGYKMPLVGLGTWKIPQDITADTVYNAIKLGYRLIDCAYDYQNEKEAGEGIRRAIKDGLVKREEIFITTKLWNNYHRKEHALKMAEEQNKVWGLGYIDLFLMHFPCALKYIDPAVRKYPAWWMDDAGTVEPDNVPIQETWQAMEELVDRGIVRSIGVSNFQAQTLYDIKTYARHPISLLQIEHHPYLVQGELVQMCKENGIAMNAYSSFGPMSFLELPAKFSEIAKETGLLFDQPVVKKIAAKHGVTSAQVLLRWSTQREIVVIPKAFDLPLMIENLEVNKFDLSQEEIDEIAKLDKGLRFNDPGFYLPNHPLHIFA